MKKTSTFQRFARKAAALYGPHLTAMAIPEMNGKLLLVLKMKLSWINFLRGIATLKQYFWNQSQAGTIIMFVAILWNIALIILLTFRSYLRG